MEGPRIALSAVVFQPQESGKVALIVDEKVIILPKFELTPELKQRIQVILDLEQVNDDFNEEEVVKGIKDAILKAGAKEKNIADLEQANDDFSEEKVVEESKAAIVTAGGKKENIAVKDKPKRASQMEI